MRKINTMFFEIYIDKYITTVYNRAKARTCLLTLRKGVGDESTENEYRKNAEVIFGIGGLS